MASDWITATIDIDRSREFTGDDMDRYSDVIDLEDNYQFVTVFIPTIDSAQITPYLQREADTDTVPVVSHFFHDISADTDVVQSTVAGTGDIVITFNIGGCRYLRLYSSENQTADRVFYCRGFDRAVHGI
jgi:hypothetical protein